MRRTTWFGLTVIVGALAFAPAPALASLDVFFESHRYAGGTTDGSYIGARNIEGTSGPGSCNPNGMFDCDFGPPTTLSVERGGQIVASNTNGSGKPGVTIVPQAGDVVHIQAGGQESATIPYAGQPTLDNNCVAAGQATAVGSFTAGATLEAKRGDPNFQNEIAAVTTSGERFTAMFSSPTRETQTIRLTETYPAPAVDGSSLTVHSSRMTIFPCKRTVRPMIRVTVQKAPSTVRVSSSGTFKVAARVLHCPDTVPFCRVGVEARRVTSSGNGKVLGTNGYKLKGGTAAAAVGRLSATGVHELKRKGRLPIETVILILPPTEQSGGIHTGKNLTLVTR